MEKVQTESVTNKHTASDNKDYVIYMLFVLRVNFGNGKLPGRMKWCSL